MNDDEAQSTPLSSQPLRGSREQPEGPTGGCDRTTSTDAWKDDAALCGVYLSAVLLVVALFAPCFTLEPHFGQGKLEGLLAWWNPNSVARQTFSLVGGIGSFYEHHEWILGTLVLLFSILFPLLKLIVLGFVLHEDLGHKSSLSSWLSILGKWSMLDVLVVAFLVILFKAFPGGTRVRAEWGIFLFGGSVVLSMLATQLTAHRKHS